MDERKFVKESVNRLLIKEYLMKETAMAGFGGLEIQRTPLGTRIVLEVERPGMVIGRKGAKIRELTDVLSEKFGVENPQIEVRESPNAYLNAQIMAQKLAMALERGWHFRRAGHSTVRRIMEAGAKGCQVIISGKLTGDRSRTEKFMAGTIKYNGKPVELVRFGYATAKTKPGIIGVTVKIMPPDAKLPDEINILAPSEAAEVEVKAEEEPKETQEKKVEEKNPPKEEVNENAQGTEGEADKGNESGREDKEAQ